MNLNLRVFSAVLILAALTDAPVFANGQVATGEGINNRYHIDRENSLMGVLLQNASEECRELLFSQCMYGTRGDDCPKLIENCEEIVSAREREAQEPGATPKTPEPAATPQTPESVQPTAEPNAADAEEDIDTSSGEEEGESSDDSGAQEAESSDEVADPELDGDVSDGS